MNGSANIRWGWLRGMYLYTAIGAGLVGLGMIVIPDVIRSLLSWPAGDPMSFGITGSVYLAFGLVSLFGWKSPLKFVPILFLQLCYKLIWLAGVIVPLLFAGPLQGYAIVCLVIFITYIVGDLIAIPFGVIFSKESDQQLER